MASKSHFTKSGVPIWGVATREEQVEHAMRKKLDRCVHFNGFPLNGDGTACALGLAPGIPLPCFQSYHAPQICTHAIFLTPEDARTQAEQRIDKIATGYQRLETLMNNKQCIHCEQPWTHRRQIGPCVYAYPCGHRQFQGKLPKEEAQQ